MQLLIFLIALGQVRQARIQTLYQFHFFYLLQDVSAQNKDERIRPQTIPTITLARSCRWSPWQHPECPSHCISLLRARRERDCFNFIGSHGSDQAFWHLVWERWWAHILAVTAQLPEGCSVPKLNNHRQFKYFLNFNPLLMVSWINARHWYLIPGWWQAAAPPGWLWRWSEMISPLWPPSNQVARMREATWLPHMSQKAGFPAFVYVLLKTCSSVRLGKCCILLLPCTGIWKALVSPAVKKLA